MSVHDSIEESVAYLRPHLKSEPEVALILGTGLGDLATEMTVSHEVEYASIPHFKTSGVSGHKGTLAFGELAGKQVVCMQGRLHGYEGHAPEDVVFPVYVMHALGASTLIITNASGAINRNYDVGDIMLIEDHINLTGDNPLTVSAQTNAGNPFPDMSYAYSPALRKRALAVAADCGVTLQKGVYMGLRGPSFETPAEIRAFRGMGADAVGMSTVHEVIAAAACGFQVLALSLISNMAAGMLDQPITEEEIIEAGASARGDFSAVLYGVVAAL